MVESTDVVVVGAGLSGLVAARELRRAGLEVVVLEAADRVGGRALSESCCLGSHLDLGGQWIGHDHHRLAALADELGATRFPMHTPPAPTVLDGTRRVRLLSPTVLGAICWLVALTLVRRTRRAERWRTRSIHDWIQKVPGRSRRLLEVAAAISWTADLRRVSVPTMMSLIQTQGGLVTMLSTKGGAQDGLIAEGVGFLVDRIAEELGDRVRTGAAVVEIARDDDGATLRTTTGAIRARRVVIAVPPPTAARISHVPELPEARADLERSSFMGSVYKAVAVYPEPFWRKRSSGELLFLDEPGCAVFDTSAPGGPGHLCLLVGGTDAETLDRLTPEERRQLLLGRIAARLGAEALEPADWREKSWHLDPWAGGGYVALPEFGGAAMDLPLTAEPIGSLHWAGAESAHHHPGYLDGAIEAGVRAAAEIVADLSEAQASGSMCG